MSVKRIAFLSCFLVSMMLFACDRQAETELVKVQTAPDELVELGVEFKQRIDQVADGIWMAVGFGLANSILIEGDDGLIVIDAMETMATGAAVAAEFRKLSNKPLAALIYTHNHADHVFGAEAFVQALARPEKPVEVIAHSSTASYVHRIITEFRPIISARSYRMFGTGLPPESFTNDGIGIELKIDENSEFGFVEPTRTFDDTLTYTVAGIELELLHAPGETNDQIFVWIDALNMLALGDNLYRAFPNLYTIRGTPHRSLKRWAKSLDMARSLSAEIVVPSHGSAIQGREKIDTILTDYRDAIRFVHDQTVRYMNLGFTPDEAVEAVQLPEHLASSPYLRELYGKVEWSVRAVYAGNLGWFDGNPGTLRPLAPLERARRLEELAGGFDGLMEALTKAQDREDHQWVLELSDVILRLDPANELALEARVNALTQRGNEATNPNERNYYLSSAMELRDGIRFEPLSTTSDTLLDALPMTTLFDTLSVNLRAEDALETNLRVGLSFTDDEQHWTVFVRRGVLEVREGLVESLDIHAELDGLVFKKILSGQRNVVAALASDVNFREGNALEFAAFLKLFKRPRVAPEPSPFATLDCCD